MAERIVNTGNNFLDPERIVAEFGLRSGDHAADFGAGHGYFTLALARAVGREGKVWAVDIQQNALDMIRSRAMAEHTLNIEYVRADLELPGAVLLPERFFDFVFMGNILFQAEQRTEILREAWRILREGGRLAMIEWNAIPTLPRIEGTGTDGTLSHGAMPSSAGNIGTGTPGYGDTVMGTMHSTSGNFSSGTRGHGTAGEGIVLSTSGNIGSGTLGPPASLRLKKQDAKALAAQAGFEPDREFSAGPHHYGLLFIKK